MNIGERSVVASGRLFQVEHEEVGREFPYEHLRRIGATLVLPITEIDGAPHVVEIHNDRVSYGKTVGLPGGNAEGGFDNPENPVETGLRELQQETGYGYPEGTNPDIDIFKLPPLSTTFRWERAFMVARNVVEIGGQETSPAESIEVQPVPLDKFMEPVLALDRGDLFQETTMAFVRAHRAVGPEGVLDWLLRGAESAHADTVVDGFGRWMTPIVSRQI
jgi:8-oxo-dGTP pyrophosphatase MutT (NUDIX family)